MAPIADPADIGLSDLFAHGGGAAGHVAAWATLALFLAALLAIWDERRGPAPGRRRIHRPRRRYPARPLAR